MRQSADYWRRVKWSKPTSIYGFSLGETELPPPVKLNEDQLLAGFRLGGEVHSATWRRVLPPDQMNKLLEIAALPSEEFDFPTQVWAKLLYDFAVAYAREEVPRPDLLNSLIPLYYGKTFSFVRKTAKMSVQQAEEFIENECMVFEETKPYLIERWPA